MRPANPRTDLDVALMSCPTPVRHPPGVGPAQGEAASGMGLGGQSDHFAPALPIDDLTTTLNRHHAARERP